LANFGGRFDELVDQGCGGRRTHSSALTAGGDGQAGSKMILAGAEVTEQQDRLRAFEVVAFGQRADAGSQDVWHLREVELLQRLDPGQVCFLHAQLDGTPFTMLQLGLKQGTFVAKVG
jgi:hypothetical protein